MNPTSRYYKYPRTPHLSWSEGVQSDDKVLMDAACFNGKLVVVTEKMDGENTTFYRDHLHARSIDSKHHPSRDWIKAFHAEIAHLIPEGWRFCGENLFARHSIEYTNLESFFYLFSIWDENNNCLSWDITLEWARSINLALPTMLYQGLWDEKYIRRLTLDVSKREGYVVRTQEGFHFKDFPKHNAKWVRQHHVQTDQQWMHQAIVLNRLK